MGNELTRYLETFYEEMTPREFYRTIFPEGELDQRSAFTHKYTGIIVEITGDKDALGHQRIKRYTLTDDLDAIDTATASDNFCICSPLSYAGWRRTAENARVCYAIAIDLDRIRMNHNPKYGLPTGLVDLFHQFDIDFLPRPTMIVSSGSGLHLYYVLETPIPLFPNYVRELQDLKRALTKKVWNDYIVDIASEHDIQQEGIYQGFRIPGTVTKRGGRARAFLTGEKTTIADLNKYVPELVRAKKAEAHKRGKISRSEAAEKYPEWYQKRIVEKQERGRWAVNRALYDWWKREISAKAIVGHRYYCLMMLAIYARKCSIYDPEKNPNPVTREELEDDCFEMFDHMEGLTETDDNHFTEADILAALEAFDDRWTTYPRISIEYRSGIAIPASKRNGRKQADHVRLMNFVRDEINKNTTWNREGNGRKSKRDDVIAWRRDHPDGKKIDCFRETGLSRVTIDKYW